MDRLVNPTSTQSSLPDVQQHRVVSVKQQGSNIIVHNESDNLAAEIAVALVYNGISQAVLMATPTNLDYLGIGFSLTEQIIDGVEQIYDCSVVSTDLGCEVQLQIAPRQFSLLKQKRRTMVGRTGCGLCGRQSLQQVFRNCANLSVTNVISAATLLKSNAIFSQGQTIFKLTGATHAAAWVSNQGELIKCFEDVGRHNALDKLIGWLSCCGQDKSGGFVAISSRASYEMVEKAAIAGIEILVAVSAPTQLAVQVAEQVNLTLVGWFRQDRFNIYSATGRIEI